ncbi:MAG: ead/Ea22-like family protein [Klebsiella huaxiensis]|uniref:ead/Ea22-like family protein n=1 Tax=Klebsiella huaxiensis TaxID=2153354 RepID=UPI0026EC578B|nr:ead/Ea22-like family protein [Klebsiella huaxiensis]WEJ90202.1 MAG: ead/Ea22-like family protein [Klebsiella huaxiensis]
MTDITELAQSLKAAAEKATPGPWIRSSVQFNSITDIANPMEQGNKPHIANTSEKRDAEFIALANPTNILALVEALEKAQQTEKTLKSRNCRLEGIITAAENRISELGKTIAEQDKRLINYAEISTRNAERAADLESRTVKLPEPFKLAKSSSGLTYYFADDVDAALTTAGIKWEAE